MARTLGVYLHQRQALTLPFTPLASLSFRAVLSPLQSREGESKQRKLSAPVTTVFSTGCSSPLRYLVLIIDQLRLSFWRGLVKVRQAAAESGPTHGCGVAESEGPIRTCINIYRNSPKEEHEGRRETRCTPSFYRYAATTPHRGDCPVLRFPGLCPDIKLFKRCRRPPHQVSVPGRTQMCSLRRAKKTAAPPRLPTECVDLNRAMQRQ